MRNEVNNIDTNENYKKWQTIIASQASSGQTQKEWCDENDVNINNLQYWKRRLKNDQELSTPKEGFVAMVPKANKHSSKLRITIGKATINIEDDVNPSLLNVIVEVLSHHV